MKKFDSDPENKKVIDVKDIAGVSINIDDKIVYASGSYGGSKSLDIGIVIKLNPKSVRVKLIEYKNYKNNYYSEDTVNINKVLVINEKF